MSQLEFIYPDWQVPSPVKACVTTRSGGVSQGPYASFNLATHVGDNPVDVYKNRVHLSETLQLPDEPLWLEPVHGIEVAEPACALNCRADAFYTDQANHTGVVMTADCLPVFIAADNGAEVAVAHAGWKGLLNGVIEASVSKFRAVPADLHVWLGPAIGPDKFEVGEDVRQAFLSHGLIDSSALASAFKPVKEGKYLADIYQLARQRLQKLGVKKISGGQYCTVSNAEMFYSYRRDNITGRMASLIWIE